MLIFRGVTFGVFYRVIGNVATVCVIVTARESIFKLLVLVVFIWIGSICCCIHDSMIRESLTNVQKMYALVNYDGTCREHK